MKHIGLAVLTLLAFGFTVQAGEKHTFTVVGVSTEVSSTAIDHYASNNYGQANTNCNAYGDSVNCNTTGYGGKNGTHYQTFINRFDAIVDGDGRRFALTCVEKWRWDTCIKPFAGQSYQAEVDGKTMWISFPQDLDGKKVKRVKYKIEQFTPLNQ